MDMWNKDCACLEVVKTIGSLMFEKRLCVMGCIASLNLNLLKGMIEKTVLCMLKEYGRLIRGSQWTLITSGIVEATHHVICADCKIRNLAANMIHLFFFLKKRRIPRERSLVLWPQRDLNRKCFFSMAYSCNTPPFFSILWLTSALLWGSRTAHGLPLLQVQAERGSLET